jgi:hypothetical protein
MPLPGQENRPQGTLTRDVRRRSPADTPGPTRVSARRAAPRWSSLAAATAVLAAIASGCAEERVAGEEPPRGTRVIIPPVLAWTRSRDGTSEKRNFLGPLYHQTQRDGGRKRSLNVLWPLFSHRIDVERSGTGSFYYDRRMMVLGPVFVLRADNYGRGYVNIDFLWPLGQYFRGERRTRDSVRSVHSLRFLPVVGYEWSWRPVRPSRAPTLRLDDTPARGDEVPELRVDERMRFRLLSIFFGVEMEPRRRRIFLVGGAPAGEDGTETTFGLIAHENGPSIDYEHQLFWRAFLVKRWGSGPITAPSLVHRKPSDFWRAFQWMWHGPPRSLVRLGPIIDYQSDWEADSKRFSILAGLFSYERKGTTRRGRIFWVVPWAIRRSGS